MRIAFDAKRIFNNHTGLGNYARALTSQLVHLYPQHVFDFYTPGIGGFKNFISGMPNVNIIIPSTFISRALPGLWRNRGMLKEMVKNKTQLYHGLSNELPIGIELTNIRSVVTIHDLIFLHYPQNYSWPDRQIYKSKFRSAVNRADKVIAASKQTKADIVHFYGTAPDKIEVIYQSCDRAFDAIYTTADKAEITKRYLLPEQFILSVGTLEKRKNQLGLLKAFSMAKLPGMHLVLIGKKGDAYKEIIEFIGLSQLQDRVIILNRVDFKDLPGLYQMAHLFVYPSFYEGFGIPVLEALKSGVPVITSGISSLPEVAGEAAVLVDPKNTTEMVNALVSVCFNEKLRTQLRAAAKKQIKLFDTVILAKQVMAVYEKLI